MAAMTSKYAARFSLTENVMPIDLFLDSDSFYNNIQHFSSERSN